MKLVENNLMVMHKSIPK